MDSSSTTPTIKNSGLADLAEPDPLFGALLQVMGILDVAGGSVDLAKRAKTPPEETSGASAEVPSAAEGKARHGAPEPSLYETYRAGPRSEIDGAPVCLTRVDFSPFKPLRAKIDRIVISCRKEDLSAASLRTIRGGLTDGGNLCFPKTREWPDGVGHAFAVDDPGLRDLQFLIDRFPDSTVYKIEVAVDAMLEAGANDLAPLFDLKTQIRHAAYPQRHERIRRGKRKKFVSEFPDGKGRPRPDRRDSPLPNGQIIWDQGPGYDALGLYIKETDQNKPVPQPWVRMEARFYASGCNAVGIRKLGMLPDAASKMRKNFAPAFFIARGFENEAEIAVGRGVAKNPWNRWGAQWTAGDKAKLRPDTEANKRIGDALNDLRRSLKRLKPPSALKGRYREWLDSLS